jgi:hypothetical protein
MGDLEPSKRKTTALKHGPLPILHLPYIATRGIPFE